MGQDVEARRFGTAIEGLDTDAEIFRRRLGILDENVEVALLVENAGVEQFEFETLPRSTLVFLDQQGVRKLRLRILVKELHVRVRRRIIQMKVVLLDVLAVIALGGSD